LKKATFSKEQARSIEFEKCEEINGKELYGGKNLEAIDAFYADILSVCGESASDGELWYHSGP
jgi:hypothetical protein